MGQEERRSPSKLGSYKNRAAQPAPGRNGYHVVLVRGTDADKPRNLAKSVTVE